MVTDYAPAEYPLVTTSWTRDGVPITCTCYPHHESAVLRARAGGSLYVAPARP